MSTAYLNGDWLPLEQAKISPLDRGFLFGDGVYEVIPVHHGKPIGMALHVKRLLSGLAAIAIESELDASQWQSLIEKTIANNLEEIGPHQGIYLHISRGADNKRNHAFPANVKPTVFSYAFSIAAPDDSVDSKPKGLHVLLEQDTRWRRCNIKSTALLGNVLHYQNAAAAGVSETLLFNEKNSVTEASTSNVFAVINDEVVTPPLDNQLLPGVTRQLVIDGINKNTSLHCKIAPISVDELLGADEIWLTSSTKEIAPVTYVNNQPINGGRVGKYWAEAKAAYNSVKFS